MLYQLLQFERENVAESPVNIDDFLGSLAGKILSEKEFKPCLTPDDHPNLIIYLAHHEEGLQRNTVNRLILDKYRKTSHPEDKYNQPDPDTKYIPLLTICLDQSHTNTRAFGIQYLDSSIWQRWIVKNDPDFNKEFPLLLDEINQYHNAKLYTSLVTREYCEFSTRIYKNSYLHEIETAGHTNDVVPFPFFQEGKFRRRFNAKQETYATDLRQLKWRVLLVDDKAEGELDSFNDGDPVNRKLVLIQNLLAELFTVEIGDPNPQASGNATMNSSSQVKPFLQIQYAPDVDTALAKMKKAHYDIILLDYLLGLESDKSEVRQLGITLLTEISKPENKSKILLGPDNRLWIFSVTSFSWAFIDHIREEGLSQYNTVWTFNRGADPVNTPNAFLYYFTEFLYSQFTEFKGDSSLVSIWENALKQFKKPETGDSKDAHHFTRNWANKILNQVLNYWNKGDSLSSLVTRATQDPKTLEKEHPFKRMWAVTILNALIGFFNKMVALEDITKADEKGSGDPGDSYFAKSFIASDAYKEIRQDYNSGLYGYLTHFLFMLSFSDGYEWEEMKTNLDTITAKIKETPDTKDGYYMLRKRIENLQELYVK